MARGDATSNGATATADKPNEELTPEQQAKKDAAKARRAQRSYIVVPMPSNMKDLFQKEATDKDQAIGPYVRDLLAGLRGIEIPVSVSAPRRKYASDEEREAAQKTRREARSNTMRNLMQTFQRLQAAGVSAEQATAIAGAVMATGQSVDEAAKGLGITLPPVAEKASKNGAEAGTPAEATA